MSEDSDQLIQLTAEVPSDLGGQRLDQVAAQLFDEYSRSRLTAWIKEGRLTVDDAVLRPKDVVHGGAMLSLQAEQEAARARVDAARTQLAASERRARLARESRGYFDKSFQLGETDLPTRLRIEADAADAERQAARSHIELAAALSAWRQALGLLPR